MPAWLLTLLAQIAVNYLAWLTQWQKNNPNTLKVVEPTDQDKKKWNDAVNYIKQSQRL